MLSAEMPSGENSVPPLRVIDLTKWYGEERAIDGVTFSASAGEVVGIIGPNGAGKTTLLETVVADGTWFRTVRPTGAPLWRE